MKEQEQGARSRNAASEASVPLILVPSGKYWTGPIPLAKFYVRKVELEEGLKFIADGHDVEQREARRRQVFARLIAASHK